MARRHCLGPWIGFGGAFDRAKARRSQRNREAAPWAKLKDHPRPWVEDFFVGRMRRCDSLGMGGRMYVWGALYGTYALVLSQWKNIVQSVLFMAVFLGYLGPPMWITLAFVPILVMQTHASEPAVYSAMLTAGGRRERFGSTLATAVVGAGLLVLFIGMVELASVALGFVMPEISFYGLTVRYRAVGVGAFYLPLIYLPLAVSTQLVLYRRRALMAIVLSALGCLVWVVSRAWQLELVAGSGTAVWAVSAAVCWCVFVLVLRHVAGKRCLVR